jgi:nucleoside-diphosphate-sugar epimerase
VQTLVLGGSSFVGGRVIERLQAAGHDLTLLNRGTLPPPDGVRQLVADRKDAAAMRAVLAGTEWDAVVDVSGFVKAAGGTAFEDLVAQLDGRVGRYVYVSSIMAYQPTGFFPWTEEQPLREEPATTYGGFKVYAERTLLERHARTGFPATIGRPAAIYGRENNIYDMEAAMFHRLRRGLPVLVPHQGLVTTSYGHVDDLCQALLECTVNPAAVGEAFNLTAEGVSSAQYVASLADIVGVEPDVVPVPDSLLPALDRQPYGHLFAARHHGVLSTDKSKRVLGCGPGRAFVIGHRQTYEWFCASRLVEADTALRDPLWGAGFDLEHEAEVAAAVREHG